MKRWNRIFAALLALAVLCGAFAEAAPEAKAEVTAQSNTMFKDEAAAIAQIRQYLVQRAEQFTIRLESTNQDGKALLGRMMDAALEHTGDPKQGDYLKWQIGGWSGSIQITSWPDRCEYEFNVQVTYYTTADQEAALNNAVQNLLSQLNLSGKSDYEKVCAVYDYVCDNITYDHDNLNDDSYLLKFTAYAALINKTSVCQGYAVLMYRLLLELGVDNRVVTGVSFGEGHAWNIVKLDGLYYNLDSTWDAGRGEYSYFLRCEKNFSDHARYTDYASDEFMQAYPMSKADYSVDLCSSGHSSVTDPAVAATCTATGLTEGAHCSVCGAVLTAQEVTPAKGHSFGPWVTVKEPTTDAEGLSCRTCAGCGDVEEKPIAKLEPDATEPDMTEPVETEPAETEPEITEPEETRPVETEPAETDPIVTDPTEPAVTEPAETDPTEPETTDPPANEREEPDDDSASWVLPVVCCVIVAAAAGIAVVVIRKKKKA